MTNPSKLRNIRVLLVDDHPVVLGGVRAGLAEVRHVELVGDASSGRQALRKAKELRPDVVLMDISLPDTSGVQLTRKLCEQSPGVKVLAFTMHENKEYVLEMIKSGAKGYVLKTTSPKELARAIATVHRGGTFYSDKILKLLADRAVTHETKGFSAEQLTPREEQILALVARGLSSKEIALQLELSVRTVDSHREKIMKKMGIHSAVGLTRYVMARAIEKG